MSALVATSPPKILTNEDLVRLTDTTDEWIVSRTGIRRRHVLEDGKLPSDLTLDCSLRTLEASGVAASDLTHIVVATCTPEMLTPSSACILAGKMGAGNVAAFDIGAACTGFLYALYVCSGLLQREPEARMLLVCVEAISRRVNWTDRSTCVLFGDGAASCILEGASSPGGSGAVLEDVLCRSDGGQRHLITIGGGTGRGYGPGDAVGEDFFLHMQGRETYRHAVRQMVNVCEDILARNGLTVADVDVFVPHQANLRIIEAVGARLGIGGERVFVNVDRYGNTSAASIPLALHEAAEEGRIPSGSRVLVTAFGAGLTWGAALLKYA
jgi:3-oxoacyl-[acyl-carrier-protein] synthase-3